MLRSPVLAAYGTMIAQQAFEPAGFRLRLGLKDVRLALDAGEARALAMPVASVVRDRFIEAIGIGLGDLDWSAVARAARPRPERPAKPATDQSGMSPPPT
jgi:3-hydroxyisobutyrate dehydrogenase-like beta-hydroxyacid dehydrogenase